MSGLPIQIIAMVYMTIINISTGYIETSIVSEEHCRNVVEAMQQSEKKRNANLPYVIACTGK